MSAALASSPAIRRVLHADLDCFFAAVEELDAPRLRGRPVVVGGDPVRRGVVSTANYLARRYGIHSAMAAAQARRLCPHAVFLRPRFERYKDLSRQVMAILLAQTLRPFRGADKVTTRAGPECPSRTATSCRSTRGTFGARPRGAGTTRTGSRRPACGGGSH